MQISVLKKKEPRNDSLGVAIFLGGISGFTG